MTGLDHPDLTPRVNFMFAPFAVATNANTNGFEEENVRLAVAAGVGLLVWFGVSAFFLNTLATALKRCRPVHRRMDPAHVWYNLVPVFNLVWMFVTVIKVADSLAAEFRSRGRRRDESFGKTLGIVLSVFGALNCGCYMGGLIPLVLLIRYGSKIANYNRELAGVQQDADDEPWEDEFEGPGDDVYGDRWQEPPGRHDHDDDNDNDDRHHDDRGNRRRR